MALKNDMEQAGDLSPYFDYAINEQCFQYRECDYPPPGLPDWVSSGKAVFNVEYKKLNCPQANTCELRIDPEVVGPVRHALDALSVGSVASRVGCRSWRPTSICWSSAMRTRT